MDRISTIWRWIFDRTPTLCSLTRKFRRIELPKDVDYSFPLKLHRWKKENNNEWTYSGVQIVSFWIDLLVVRFFKSLRKYNINIWIYIHSNKQLNFNASLNERQVKFYSYHCVIIIISQVVRKNSCTHIQLIYISHLHKSILLSSLNKSERKKKMLKKNYLVNLYVYS